MNVHTVRNLEKFFPVVKNMNYSEINETLKLKVLLGVYLRRYEYWKKYSVHF